MRQLTLTLVLVLVFVCATPVAAQEAPSLSVDKAMTLLLERIDQWMFDLVGIGLDDEVDPAKTGSDQEDNEDNPVDPNNEFGPLLEPNG